MLSALSKWKLRSRIRENEKTEKAFLSWDKINSVAIIIAEDPQLNRNALDKWIKDTKKMVEVFYVETKSKAASYGDWNCFSKKDTTLLDLPRKEVETALASKKFDLVINTSEAEDFFSAALLSILKAPFKCAANAPFQDANLIVRPSVKGNLIHQLQDTLRYLQMIKMNHY
jgi:hypothetical protein